MAENKDQDKTWAALCHIAALAGIILPAVGSILGPLIVWIMKKDSSALVDKQGKEALNFQITMLMAAAIAFLLSFLLIGIPLLIAVGIFNLVMIIIASIKVSNGEDYKYPFAIRLIK